MLSPKQIPTTASVAGFKRLFSLPLIILITLNILTIPFVFFGLITLAQALFINDLYGLALVLTFPYILAGIAVAAFDGVLIIRYIRLHPNLTPARRAQLIILTVLCFTPLIALALYVFIGALWS